jgi:hypothetical protein
MHASRQFGGVGVTNAPDEREASHGGARGRFRQPYAALVDGLDGSGGHQVRQGSGEA